MFACIDPDIRVCMHIYKLVHIKKKSYEIVLYVYVCMHTSDCT